MKQKPYFFLAVLILSSLACSLFSGATTPEIEEEPTNLPQAENPAPDPTDAPSQTEGDSPSEDACLIGTWTVVGFEQYMSSVIPPEVIAMGVLTYDGMSGEAAYSFSPDNGTSIQADEFTVSYLIDVAGMSMSLDVIVDGSGSAHYSVDGDKLLFSDIDANTVFMSIKLNGIETGSAEPIPGIFPGGDTNSTVTYLCDGNMLYMTMPIENSEPVILERSSP